MNRFKKGDRVRRVSGTDWGNVTIGGEYTVSSHYGNSITLENSGWRYLPNRFEYVEPATPAETFDEITNYIRRLFSEPLIRVGDVYSREGITREIIGIYEDYVWTIRRNADYPALPFSMNKSVFKQRWTRQPKY